VYSKYRFNGKVTDYHINPPQYVHNRHIIALFFKWNNKRATGQPSTN